MEKESRVLIPLFEEMGPACDIEGCNGVKMSTVCLKTQDHYLKCSKCGAETCRETRKELIDRFSSLVQKIIMKDE